MTSPDVLVIGAGIAGAALVQALLEDPSASAERIRWIDAPSPESASRASDNPGALFHAFPGRSLLPKPELLCAAEAAQSWLGALQQTPGVRDALVRTAMIRPGYTHALGRRYVKTYRRGAPDYPHWLTHELASGEDIARRFPYLDPAPPEAVVYGPAFCVHVPQLIEHLTSEAEARGVALEPARLAALEPREASWRAHFACGEAHDAEHIVLAVGDALASWFPDADLAINHGELLLVHPVAGVELDCAISGGGHISPGPGGVWVAGSTYIRDDDELAARTDALAERDLHDLIGRFFPALRDASTLHIWRERRLVAMPDRQPVAGRIPEQPGLWVFGALGSKAMMWTRLCAQSIVGALTRGAATPELVSPRRVGGAWRLR